MPNVEKQRSGATLHQFRIEMIARLDERFNSRRETQSYSDVRKTEENVSTEGDHSDDEWGVHPTAIDLMAVTAKSDSYGDCKKVLLGVNNCIEEGSHPQELWK